MARLSVIEQLPEEARELIARMRAGGAYIDTILDALHDEGHIHVARSTLGRHIKNFDEMIERTREARAVAEALVRPLDDRAESRIAQANIEMMHSMVMKLVCGDGAFDAKEVHFLARALKDLASAGKIDVSLQKEVRATIAREVAAQTEHTAATVEKMAAESGLSAEAAAAIRAEVLGIRVAQAPIQGDGHG